MKFKPLADRVLIETAPAEERTVGLLFLIRQKKSL